MPSFEPMIARIVLVVLGTVVISSAHAAPWRLLGRHGECAELSTLKRKLPDMPPIDSPQALAAYLDAKRIAYSRRTHSLGAVEVVEFQVPDAGLALLIAPESACRSLAVPRG